MYPSDIKDEEWSLIERFFKRRDPRGAIETHPKRSIVNAIFYVIKSGIHWRMLPNDLPPWSTVYCHYRNWNLNGTWEKVLDFLNRKTRKKKTRDPEPTYAIVDSQSVKTQYASEERGIDGGKKIKGRKRHICVDTLGNLLCVMVHAANIHRNKSMLSSMAESIGSTGACPGSGVPAASGACPAGGVGWGVEGWWAAPGTWDWPPLLPADPGAPGAGSHPVGPPRDGATGPFTPAGSGFG